MRLWKWVETSTCGQCSPLAIQCRRVAVSSDSPSFYGEGRGGEGMEGEVKVGEVKVGGWEGGRQKKRRLRKGRSLNLTCIHSGVGVSYTHKQ